LFCDKNLYPMGKSSTQQSMTSQNLIYNIKQMYRIHFGKIQLSCIGMVLFALLANVMLGSQVTTMCVASDGSMELKTASLPCSESTDATCPGVPSPVNPHEAGFTPDNECCYDIPFSVEPFLTPAPVRTADQHDLYNCSLLLIGDLLAYHQHMLANAPAFSDIPPPYYTNQTWSCIKSTMLLL